MSRLAASLILPLTHHRYVASSGLGRRYQGSPSLSPWCLVGAGSEEGAREELCIQGLLAAGRNGIGVGGVQRMPGKVRSPEGADGATDMDRGSGTQIKCESHLRPSEVQYIVPCSQVCYSCHCQWCSSGQLSNLGPSIMLLVRSFFGCYAFYGRPVCITCTYISPPPFPLSIITSAFPALLYVWLPWIFSWVFAVVTAGHSPALCSCSVVV